MKKVYFIPGAILGSLILGYLMQFLQLRIYPCLITPVLPPEYGETTYFGWCPGYNAGITGISYDFWPVYLSAVVYCLVVILLGGLLISKLKK